jgi:hypothetical protein
MCRELVQTQVDKMCCLAAESERCICIFLLRQSIREVNLGNEVESTAIPRQWAVMSDARTVQHVVGSWCNCGTGFTVLNFRPWH